MEKGRYLNLGSSTLAHCKSTQFQGTTTIRLYLTSKEKQRVTEASNSQLPYLSYSPATYNRLWLTVLPFSPRLQKCLENRELKVKIPFNSEISVFDNFLETLLNTVRYHVKKCYNTVRMNRIIYGSGQINLKNIEWDI